TYYKYEPWEEYLTLISNIELSSNRIVQISLSNYTNTNPQNSSILKNNLNQWQKDLTTIYPGYGITLSNFLEGDTGLETSWNANVSFSEAKVNFTMNIESLGLTEYNFMTTELLKMTIFSPNEYPTNSINVTVSREDDIPVFNLKKENFQILSGSTIANVTSRYDESYSLIYTIFCDEPINSSITLSVCDQRGIKVQGSSG
ncbi:MAG: hypothetical protein P8Y18_09750, partial [Candidatus Bathyarchaeota archaeon]